MQESLMSAEFVEDFLLRFAKSAVEGDHAGHMAMVSKKVRVLGVPGFEAIDYDSWSQQCAHEFPQFLIRSIEYVGIDIKQETGTLVCFETHEKVEASDGTVNSNRLEIFIECEEDGKWRIVQESILPTPLH
jgi:hypothetical protein